MCCPGKQYSYAHLQGKQVAVTFMGSPGSREAILTAQDNIERHLQQYDRPESSEPGETRSTSPTWTQNVVNNGNTELVVQFHDHPEFRGAANAMMHLVQTHGVEKLQRVGIVGQGSVPHTREMALAAGLYNIPVHSEASAPNDSDKTAELKPTSPLDIGRLEIDNAVATSPTATGPITFPSNEDIESVYGQGTIAFELERELASRNHNPTLAHKANKSRPDIVISDLDGGITLSGICMAFAGTGTHVFGAAPEFGFWDHVWNPPGAAMSQDDHGRRYWAGTKQPMSHIPWSTFTAPGRLSGIFEVNHEQVHAARFMARDHYQLELKSDEAVPLAVALYNEEFQKFASKGAKQGRKRVVGVILRSRKDYQH